MVCFGDSRDSSVMFCFGLIIYLLSIYRVFLSINNVYEVHINWVNMLMGTTVNLKCAKINVQNVYDASSFLIVDQIIYSNTYICSTVM
jgi:hypothetical protein